MAAVEAALVSKAKRMDPKALHAAGRRALEAIERDRKKVDAAEDAQLRDEEEAARAKTRCTLHDNGDGTMRITATVPTLAGAILKKILDQMSSPRRGRLGATQAQIGALGNPTAEGFEWDRRRGEALVSLIEHLPTDHLHGPSEARRLRVRAPGRASKPSRARSPRCTTTREAGAPGRPCPH